MRWTCFATLACVLRSPHLHPVVVTLCRKLDEVLARPGRLVDVKLHSDFAHRRRERDLRLRTHFCPDSARSLEWGYGLWGKRARNAARSAGHWVLLGRLPTSRRGEKDRAPQRRARDRRDFRNGARGCTWAGLHPRQPGREQAIWPERRQRWCAFGAAAARDADPRAPACAPSCPSDA